MGEHSIDVRVSEYALPILQEWKRRATQSPQHTEALAYTAVKAAIGRVVGDPQEADNAKYHLRKDLAPVCRIKIAPGSRYRIFYIVSLAKRQAVILMVGFRKRGNKHDAYNTLKRLLRQGEFDEVFGELGLSPPDPKKVKNVAS